MRPSSRRAPWQGLALLAVCTLSPTAFADQADRPAKKPSRSVAACTTFDQTDRDSEDGVDFKVTSTCDVKLACSIKWKLTCSPESKKKRRSTWEGYAFELAGPDAAETTASAASCGNEGWEIASISWSCQPVAAE
jgi:hypothetical protein